MKELWKPVPYRPYDKRYSISSLGRARIDVKSPYSHSKTNYLRAGIGARGYPCYTFYYNGKKKQCFAHRTVLLAFMGEPPEGKPLALHLDDNKLNNQLTNLKWGDTQDNMNLMVIHERSLVGALNPRAKLSKEQVYVIRELYQNSGLSQTELAATFGVDQTQISRIVLRKAWGHI